MFRTTKELYKITNWAKYNEPLARDVAFRLISKRGRKKWKEEGIDYNVRFLAKAAIYRHKTSYGDKSKNKLSVA